MIFDTHAHYDDPRFDGDRDIILNELAGRGIGTVVDVSASFDGIEGVIALAERYPFLYATVGVHPSEVAELTEEHMAKMAEWAKHPRVVAIGEIGLDYHYLKEERIFPPIICSFSPCNAAISKRLCIFALEHRFGMQYFLMSQRR